MQGEIDVILDLVSGIDEGQHLAIGMVTPGQMSLQTQNRERALALSAKQTQLQVHKAELRCMQDAPHRVSCSALPCSGLTCRHLPGFGISGYFRCAVGVRQVSH